MGVGGGGEIACVLYDMSRLAHMFQKMTVRAELWKYVDVSTHAILDWKNKLFKKVNVVNGLGMEV